MTTIMTYGRNRDKFQKLFADAKFEGYECNIRFAYFSFKNKVSKTKIQAICEIEKIKINFE
jgi:hypothetical protein